jgi:hypothetical protein
MTRSSSRTRAGLIETPKRAATQYSRVKLHLRNVNESRSSYKVLDRVTVIPAVLTTLLFTEKKHTVVTDREKASQPPQPIHFVLRPRVARTVIYVTLLIDRTIYRHSFTFIFRFSHWSHDQLHYGRLSSQETTCLSPRAGQLREMV